MLLQVQVEEGMALDDIWLSLLTSSFTLAHKPWQRTQASVQRVLERHNIPTVWLLIDFLCQF